MTILLRALASLAPADRNEVIVPSYTCYSVAASVLKAGLRPRIVDVVPETLDYDHDRLARTDVSRVLAVIATNLYGLPNDMPRLASLTRDAGIFLVDDAAQALGARFGRASGTWGDAGLYSFDKGKNVSAIDGGVIVSTSAAVGAAVAGLVRDLPRPGTREMLLNVCKVGAYSTLLRPPLYWIPQAIPQLALGTTKFTTDMALEALPRGLASMSSRRSGGAGLRS
jgi:dTDP-4-amino-4,6-dideoxygalactose transaminase